VGSSLGNCNDRLIAKCFGCREDLGSPVENDVLSGYDALFVTMSKRPAPHETRWMECAWRFKEAFPEKKLIVYQEADDRWPTYVDWPSQRDMYELLQVTDLFLAHNESDADTYRLLMGPNGQSMYFPSIQELPMIERFYTPYVAKTAGSVLVNAFDNRSGGLCAALIAKKCGAQEILHFNTTTYHDNRNADAARIFGLRMTEIPSMGWTSWARAISPAAVYVSPLAVVAAGRDTIACAVLGIPVIGNAHSTPQQKLFPALAINPNYIPGIEATLESVLRGSSASDVERMIVEPARKAVYAEYSVEAGLAKADGILKRLGWRK
jgi:hypothetical protein